MIEIDNWTPRPFPTNEKLTGRYVDVVEWNAIKHGPELWRAFGATDTNAHLYHFGWPRFNTANDLADKIQSMVDTGHYVFCVFESKKSAKALGMASYMRTDTANGVVEIGCVAHGMELAGTPAATEAHYLMAKRVFETWGYRRYEWKLNNPNQASHRAARRMGFTFEGLFRQLEVKPYGNRDTAWYSMLDREWPQIATAFENWLQDDNFRPDGSQITSLSDLTKRELTIGSCILKRADETMHNRASDFQRDAYARTKRVIGTYPIPLGWDYKKRLAQCENWYCEDAQGWAGLLMLKAHDGQMCIESIAVREGTNGLGTVLMEAAFMRAAAFRLSQISLITHAKNPAALWYERLGFTITLADDKSELPVLHMKKTIGG